MPTISKEQLKCKCHKPQYFPRGKEFRCPRCLRDLIVLEKADGEYLYEVRLLKRIN